MTAKAIRVTGKVQGVNFRFYTREEALRLGLNGTVMNLADGSVLIRAEGPPEKVEALVDWCRRGPSRARVDSLELEEVAPEGFSGFFILR